MSDSEKIPQHIAIIPDGNRRWAKAKNLPTLEGHRRGADRIYELSKKARDLGVKMVTIWAFSTENWGRSSMEVQGLMHFFHQGIDAHLKTAIKEKTRIIHLGRKDRLSPRLQEKIKEAEEKTKEFAEFTLAIALDYGGHDEVLRAIKRAGETGIDIAQLTEEQLSSFMDTAHLPHPSPDLIIRTGGELRTSGFMLWQSAYSEYFFTSTLFPDFSADELSTAIADFSNRKRRFGT